jgi:hypothetical protein
MRPKVRTIVKGEGSPPAWLVVDAAAIGDVDYSAGGTLGNLHD